MEGKGNRGKGNVRLGGGKSSGHGRNWKEMEEDVKMKGSGGEGKVVEGVMCLPSLLQRSIKGQLCQDNSQLNLSP